MKLRKVLVGACSVAFLFVLCQGVRTVLSQGKIALICNPGGAFSLALPVLALLGLAVGALILFSVQWWREEYVPARFAWLFLIGGGVSNLFERLSYGCVTDYIRLGDFPTFNLADILLTIGVAGILWKGFLGKKKTSQ